MSLVAPAIRAALTSFEQGDSFEHWTTRQQTAALATTTCREDVLPVPAPVELETFVGSHGSSIADDLDGDPVFMAKSPFDLRYNAERAPQIRFTDIKDVRKAA